MRSKDYDVIIAGASCAGLHAARLLAETGRRVAVFERRKALGEPARIWIVTNELNQVLGADASETIVNRVTQLELNSRHKTTTVNLRSPDLIVERSLMLAKLAGMAQNAGVEIYTETKVNRVVFAPSGVQVSFTRNGDGKMKLLHTQHLIGADGTYSQTARTVNTVRQFPQNTVQVVQAHVKLPLGYDPHLVKVWFDRRATRFFYWLIPESSETAVLGLVADRAEGLRNQLDGFINHHGFEAISYQGAVIPLHQPLWQLEWQQNGSRILLVGDAAAHVKVTTVGGLVSGLWGARAAANCLIYNTTYSAELIGLNRELYLHDLIRWILDRFNDDDYDQLLDRLNRPLRQLLEQRNRDSMSQSVWQLLTSQPMLVLLAVKRILFPSHPSFSNLRISSVTNAPDIKTRFS